VRVPISARTAMTYPSYTARPSGETCRARKRCSTGLRLHRAPLDVRGRLARHMTQLLITKVALGVVKVTSTDPFSSLELYRIDREAWQASPAEPGIYLLYGFVDNEAVVYIGMSTTNIRDRVRSHHVTPRKDWFGVLFAIPMPSTILTQAVEAELIRRVREAAVVSVVANVAAEARFLDTDDVHLEPALNAIIDSLQILLGNDIFTPADDEGPVTISNIEPRTSPLARVYKGPAEAISERMDGDPASATHRWVHKAVNAWGRFEAPEPDTRFRVLAGSAWRAALTNPEYAPRVLKQQQRVAAAQRALVNEGVCDEATRTYTQDHVFDSWTRAAHAVSGVGSYSGGYHWQRLEGGGAGVSQAQPPLAAGRG
jgi:hypothetical protein